MRYLVLIFAVAVTVPNAGCAHFAGPPPPTQMVEVTDGSIVPGSPPHEVKQPMTRRRALFISGGVLTVAGAVVTAVGVGILAGSQGQDDFGAAIGHGIGAFTLILGVPILLAGGALFAFGAGSN
jgi:hypothetical protein